ncbi:MAG: hypothetical protein JST52_06720 [Bacteroidetes bacterium]|nr:hypothetical protein [Bacteroidota bacterium]MBS1738941.1 hypothetical protein [Bacteroidota bacterium]
MLHRTLHKAEQVHALRQRAYRYHPLAIMRLYWQTQWATPLVSGWHGLALKGRNTHSEAVTPLATIVTRWATHR